jgi:PAS domain S-box-containing protein
MLAKVMKIPRVVGQAGLKCPDEGVLEKGKMCEILRQGGPHGVGKGLPVESVCGDLLEKNEYLRAVNEEIIKLTQSLDATNTELETTRVYLDNLIQNSADMIVSTGRGRIITLCNRRAEEVLGYKSDEVLGQPVDILYEAGEAQRVEKHLRQQPDGKLMEYEIRLRTKGGITIPARLTASLLYDRSGHLMGSVGACTDLTHTKALEDELLKQQKLLAVAELGGAASHELNQPLTVALGRIQLIFRREGKDCAFRRDLIDVEKALEKMAEMVRQIGQITHYKTKPYIGQSQIIDLNQSVNTSREEKNDRRQVK